MFFTRWLSFADSVQAMSACYSSIISALYAAAIEKEVKARALLQGVASQMGSYKFAYMTAFLADAMGLLAILSKVMQKEDITFTSLQPQLESTAFAIKALLTTDGPHMLEFKNNSTPETDGSDYMSYRGHDLKDSNKQREDATKASENFVNALMMHLELAFPYSQLMSALMIFDPRNVQEDSSYGL